MPEGPSIVILKEAAADFAGRRIVAATGNARLDKTRLEGQRIVALPSWGKHFLIECAGFAVRVHFMLFGSYSIDARKEGATPRLGLAFARGRELNFYACSVRYLEGDLDLLYDWRADVMSEHWDPAVDWDRAEQWRERAASLAEDHPKRAAYIEIAEGYERLAALLEKRGRLPTNR